MNRRELLQYFGIGTLITPVIGGAPVVEVAAKLLSVPDVEANDIPVFPDGHVPELYSNRLKWNPYEAIWLAMWQIENCSRWSPLYGPLNHVLGREASKEEKEAVAAIVQWFGTNVGNSFVEAVLHECGRHVVRLENGNEPALRKFDGYYHRSSIGGSQFPIPAKHSFSHFGHTVHLQYGSNPVITPAIK